MIRIIFKHKDTSKVDAAKCIDLMARVKALYYEIFKPTKEEQKKKHDDIEKKIKDDKEKAEPEQTIRGRMHASETFSGRKRDKKG
jgi:hypothetical protein